MYVPTHTHSTVLIPSHKKEWRDVPYGYSLAKDERTARDFS